MPKSVAKLALTTGVMVLTTLISAPVSAQTNGNPVLSPAQPQTSQAVKPTNEGAIIRSVKVVPDAAPPAEWRAPTAEACVADATWRGTDSRQRLVVRRSKCSGLRSEGTTADGRRDRARWAGHSIVQFLRVSYVTTRRVIEIVME